MTSPPPPSALRALWTRRRWFEAFGHKGQGPGHVERTAQMLQWCWGRRDAGSSLEPSPTHYEGLDGHQSLKERLHIKTLQKATHSLYIKQTCDVDLPCQSHICLAHSAEQSAVVDQPRDTVIYNQLADEVVVEHISINKRT